jgi:serine/threonine protein kinase
MSIDLAWLGQKFPDLSPIAPLGTGGQKTVFSAQHPTDGDVVLKIIHPQHDPETANREMLAVKAVQSPRVPRILDNGTITTTLGNSIWIREQRVSGTPLSERLQSGPIDPTRLLKLGLHMLEALVSAEQVHIVHRDVKPDNIMCDTNDNFWLLDFGVARHLRLQSLTATSSPFGKFTPGYAPPEQFRNIKHDIDARADLGRADPRALAATAGREPDPAEACVRRERGERILATLVVLHDRSGPIAYRAVTLHWLDGRPAAEVAAELHLTPGQLRGLLDRAKTTLRARLERDG